VIVILLTIWNPCKVLSAFPIENKRRIDMTESNHKTGPPKTRWFLVTGAVLLLAILLYACAPAPTPEPTVIPTSIPPTPTATPIPDQSEFLNAWANGPHSALYDIGKGPNTMCTRCHSPLNWQPASRPGRPPNCVTCKFPTDPELRIAPSLAEGGMDLVTEEQWVGIPCKQCHEVDANGTASAEIAWLNPIALTYTPLNTPNELCTKCHVDGTGNAGSGGNGANHEIILGGSAHANFAGAWPQEYRPQYCTDCHDPHSSQVKQCEDCHTKTAETHTDVLPMMDTVTCMACHDASGAEVGYPVEGGPFTTMLTTAGTRGAPDSVAEIVSHSIVWKVSCTRCHSAENAWGLPVLTAAGAPVATPTPGATP
jgi:hypothetical protein